MVQHAEQLILLNAVVAWLAGSRRRTKHWTVDGGKFWYRLVSGDPAAV